MVIDNKTISEFRRHQEIPEELAKILLNRLGEEPEPYEYSEQDIAEQSRKLIARYHSTEGRLELLYDVDKRENQLLVLRSRIRDELNTDNGGNAEF